jgi:hypothetical protein
MVIRQRKLKSQALEMVELTKFYVMNCDINLSVPDCIRMVHLDNRLNICLFAIKDNINIDESYDELEEIVKLENFIKNMVERLKKRMKDREDDINMG